ncbi:hypothetical protein V8E36_004877 [Tilletia maclaganii]
MLLIPAGSRKADSLLYAPPGRVCRDDDDNQEQAPCGGYTIQNARRSPWYFWGGPVKIDSDRDSATINIRISYAENPTQASDFAALPALRENLALRGDGDFCFNVDASRAFPPGQSSVSAGQNATLLVEYLSSVHGAQYQCAAVTFVDAAAEGVGSTLRCTDALTASDDDDDDDDLPNTTTIGGSGISGPLPTATTIISNGGAVPSATVITTTVGSGGNTGAGVRALSSGAGGGFSAVLAGLVGVAGVAALM